MNREITAQQWHSQQGFVLIVSMMILMVITMIGVTAISTSTLEGRMAHNLQHTMYAFQAAESLIEDTIRSADEGDPAYIEADNPALIAYDAGIGAPIMLPIVPNPNMANYQNAIGAGVVLSTAGSSITRTGAGIQCPGYSPQFKCVPFQISSAITVNTSNASINNIQGVEVVIQ